MLNIGFLYQDLLRLIAEGLDLRFLDVFTALQLLDPLIDVETLLLGRHVSFRNYNLLYILLNYAK